MKPRTLSESQLRTLRKTVKGFAEMEKVVKANDKELAELRERKELKDGQVHSDISNLRK